ncbi:MAG: metalloregulator ArsR/SmtB family transcription factor [Candidatus Dormibacteraeota bacterium]|nr:metalloregulator ArsR/SmtB family transcription factor [Candidatus Dormibacteraeota bacterium]
MTRTRLTAVDPEAAIDAEKAMPDAKFLDLVVDAFQVLADRTRAKILYALSRRPLCVRDIAIAVGSSESATSHQLRLLRERRLVKAVRRDGNQIEYRLDDHHVANLFREAEYHADHVRKGLPDHL